MAAHWCNKRQTRVGCKYSRSDFVEPNCWVDDWDYSGDGLLINGSGARHLGQLY